MTDGINAAKLETETKTMSGYVIGLQEQTEGYCQ